MKPAYLTLAFLLELCMLAAISYWGFQQKVPLQMRYILGIGLPVVVIILWGYFAAPKSKHRLPFSIRLIFETILLLTSAFLLNRAGQSLPAILFVVLIAVRQSVSVIRKW